VTPSSFAKRKDGAAGSGRPDLDQAPKKSVASMTSRQLGFLFLAPAATFILLFFLLPVLLTVVFSFTNMTTATGITGGAWQVNPGAMRRLAIDHEEPDLAEALQVQAFVVDATALDTLRQAGQSQALIDELERTLLGQSFGSRREIARAIRDLDNRPRSTREVNALANRFERSLVGNRYDSEDSLLAAIAATGLTLTPEQAAAVTEATWTGWSWTTENFERMVSLPDTVTIFLNTIFYVFTTLIFFNTGFALILAITTHYMPEGAAGWFRSIWLLPRVLPAVLYVLMWKWLAWDTGFLSSFLGQFGVPPRNWMLNDAASAWVFVIVINGTVGASMGMLIFASAIKAIPQQIFYASEVDGASRWQQIRHIILPQLKWPILFITTYQSLSLLTSFEHTLLATDGGPGGATEVWALHAYHTALSNYAGNLAYGYGAALALVLVIIGILLSAAYLLFFDFKTLVRPPRIER
jgi:inositol-phosphate transport system permease protein